jgi:hypothetical protein
MQYLTKTQLTKRWSRDLVDFYFPTPSEIKVNPINSRYTEMQLYDVYRIMEIEHLETFKKDWRKVLERRYKRLINKQLNN